MGGQLMEHLEGSPPTPIAKAMMATMLGAYVHTPLPREVGSPHSHWTTISQAGG